MAGLYAVGVVAVVMLAVFARYAADRALTQDERRRVVARGWRGRGWSRRWTLDDIDRMWSK